MRQRSTSQPYLRFMTREIQWDDVRVERTVDMMNGGKSSWTQLGPRTWSVLVDGMRFKVECEQGPNEEGHLTIRINGIRREVRVLDERTKLLEKMGMSVSAGKTSGNVKAPMPGKVLQVLVSEGDVVEEGQPLLVLEAMKMENVIKAAAQGEVKDVPVKEGQAVEKGALLVSL